MACNEQKEDNTTKKTIISDKKEPCNKYSLISINL